MVVDLVDDAGTVHVTFDDGHVIGLVQKPWPGQEPGFRADRFRLV